MSDWVWLDMDGTIADFYGVEGWLGDLLAHNTRPYEKAEILYSPFDLLEVLYGLKGKGYKIGVISWCSRENNREFNNRTKLAKLRWLEEKQILSCLDEFIVTDYGKRKADACRQYGYGILVDDEEQNRNAWDLGLTINANENILIELNKLLDK